MRIGIIVLSWNSLRFIDQCLTGLLAHEKSVIYVVDNGSNDGSVEHIKKTYPTIILLPLPVNIGFGPGNNYGIRRALADGCEAVFLLNNDTIIDESFIGHCVSVLESNAGVGIVGPVIVEGYDPSVIQCAGGHMNLWTLVFPYMHRGQPYQKQDKIVKTDYVLGAAMLIHKDVIACTDGFDPEYGFAYIEEADLCYRARKKGFETTTTYGARVIHLGEMSSGGSRTALRRMIHNRFLFALKHSGVMKFLFASQYIILRVLYDKLFQGKYRLNVSNKILGQEIDK